MYNEIKLYNIVNRNWNICVIECMVNEEVVYVVIMFCVCDFDILIVLIFWKVRFFDYFV